MNSTVLETLFTRTSDVPFCEGKINGIPEVWNTVSSLFISYVAFCALKYSNLTSNIRSIYYLLFLNGIGSMGYHWVIKGSLGYVWKMLDQFTMILALWLGVTICIRLCNNSNTELYTIHSLNIGMLIFSSCEYDELFRTAFGLEALLLIKYYNQLTRRLYINDFYNFGKQGLYISVFAGLFWIMTELFCNKYLILGHTVWHIGISYGMHLLLQFINTVKSCLPTVSRQVKMKVENHLYIPILISDGL